MLLRCTDSVDCSGLNRLDKLPPAEADLSLLRQVFQSGTGVKSSFRRRV